MLILSFSFCLLCACSSVSYYSQSITGQFEILQGRKPIPDVIQDQQTPEPIRQKLMEVENILQFAGQQLSLPNNGSYQHYVDLQRPYVVWNVFAAPTLSLQPVRWCFLFVGCLSYRGYFNKDMAVKFANELQQQELDVYIGGVAAYSTLGWFNDPVMNTMLAYEPHYLARLIFHELSHQKLYIKDDTEFNEAFADAVALIGVKRWAQTQHPSALDALNLELQYEQQFIELVLRYRTKLQSLYTSTLTAPEKLVQKQKLIDAIRDEYEEMRSQWNGYSAYDAWFAGTINNAKFSALATYRNHVPDFLEMYSATGNDLDLFYTVVEQLESCDKAKRYQYLQAHVVSIDC